ncbi:CDP-glucose 4,6-dehydratase [Ramlibacter sp.]|uniref:CDP-glucose 4,6-dehydratase n=1 Tax=Ramlibacter sp. TaxID=1917967 RepID=UPI003D135952
MNAPVRPDIAFWRGKRVLLTGHTGFKGAWLSLWLHRLGAQVVGLSLPPATQPELFGLAGVAALIDSRFGDIRDPAAVAAVVQSAQPEVVLHLAAQALVHEGYRQPLATFATNVQGTAHVLDALRNVTTVKAVVAVTTDKVYQNLEHPFPYRETDALGGHDPYSASKAACELVIACYRASYLAAQGMAVASARAGNVIGGGDWSADRLIPDAVRAWSSGRPLTIRRPTAIRPWQHVLEPLAGYLRLAERLWAGPEAAGPYNFGPPTDEAATVREVIELARAAYSQGTTEFGGGDEWPHEAGWLALETAKSRHALDVVPRWSLSEAVQRTMAWYRGHADGRDARALCAADIDAYEATLQ